MPSTSLVISSVSMMSRKIHAGSRFKRLPHNTQTTKATHASEKIENQDIINLSPCVHSVIDDKSLFIAGRRATTPAVWSGLLLTSTVICHCGAHPPDSDYSPEVISVEKKESGNEFRINSRKKKLSPVTKNQPFEKINKLVCLPLVWVFSFSLRCEKKENNLPGRFSGW